MSHDVFTSNILEGCFQLLPSHLKMDGCKIFHYNLTWLLLARIVIGHATVQMV